jgi:hypothetical protein
MIILNCYPISAFIMLLLFAHKCRAYLGFGYPKSESPDEFEIMFTKHIQVSDRRKLVRGLCRQLGFEGVRPNVPFRALGDTGFITDTQINEQVERGLPHVAFAIFAIQSGGFVLRSLELTQDGAWIESSRPVINGVLYPNQSNGSLEPVANNAAGFLLHVLRKQKRGRDRTT